MGSTVVGPYPQGNQATYQGPSAALVAVHKNADLVSQFSVHMQSIETAGIVRQGQPTAMLAPKGRETPEGALQRARGPFPAETGHSGNILQSTNQLRRREAGFRREPAKALFIKAAANPGGRDERTRPARGHDRGRDPRSLTQFVYPLWFTQTNSTPAASNRTRTV